MDDNHRQPDLPELPDNDDETGPAKPSLAKRLLMARELRGWVVAAAALMVATAAVAPDLPFDRLTGAVAVSKVQGIASDLTCDAEDQTGGVGGQSISCGFTCPENPGTVSVSVNADDNDAQVSGTADCSGDTAHCSGRQTCSATEARTGTGTGSCSADSDEAVDSGLYVQCSASADQLPTPGDDLGSEICPVTEPLQVCIQPVCYMLDSPLVATCQLVWEKMAEAVNPHSTTVAFLVDAAGNAVGLECQGTICVPIEPRCVGNAKTGRFCTSSVA